MRIWSSERMMWNTVVFLCQVVIYWEGCDHWQEDWNCESWTDFEIRAVHEVRCAPVHQTLLVRAEDWSYFDLKLHQLNWGRQDEGVYPQQTAPQPHESPDYQYTPFDGCQTWNHYQSVKISWISTYSLPDWYGNIIRPIPVWFCDNSFSSIK